jgi:hypothetical protein
VGTWMYYFEIPELILHKYEFIEKLRSNISVGEQSFGGRHLKLRFFIIHGLPDKAKESIYEVGILDEADSASPMVTEGYLEMMMKLCLMLKSFFSDLCNI